MPLRQKKILKLAKGFHGNRKNVWRVARLAVWKSLQHAYKMRKQKKREMKQLWIKQINAACNEHELKYGQFMHGLHISGCEINRKMLAELARMEPLSFYSVVQLSTLSRKVAAAGLNPHTVNDVPLPYRLYDFPQEFDAERENVTQQEYDLRASSVEKSLRNTLEREKEEDTKFEAKLKQELAKKKAEDDLYFGSL